VRKPQIILALGQVIGEFISERKADARRGALAVN